MTLSEIPVQMGILGCAAVSEYAIIDPWRSKSGIEVAAIASRDIRKAREFADRHGILKAQTYEQMLADADLEAIYVPLPNSMHCEWTIRALEAGKAVLCEKPLASNAKEAQRMADAARATGQLLVEAFHWRYHPISHRISEIVSSGVLGTLRSIDVQFLIPHDFFKPDDIRYSYDLSGGSVMDGGCYCINFLRLLLGEPERILSAKAIQLSPDVDGQMEAAMLFADGCLGRFTSSQIYQGESIETFAEIVGQKGSLRVKGPFTPHWGNALELTIGEKFEQETVSEIPSYVFQAREFAEVIRNKAAIRTPASDGIANMKVIDEVYRIAGLRVRGSPALSQGAGRP